MSERFTKAEAHQSRRLGLVLVVTATFAGLELVGAILARSDVLQAEAIHLFLDVVALAFSMIAMRLAVRAPTDRFTFGLRRVEPLAAAVNGVLVLVAAYAIVREAAADLQATTRPLPTLMLIVASAALFVHGFSAWLVHDAIERTHEGHEHGPGQHGHALNLRGVLLHLAGDTLGAVAAVIAAIVIRAGGSAIFDPLGGLVVALILVVGAVSLLRDAALVLLDAAPRHLPASTVREVVAKEPGVTSVRELRVWTLGAGHDAVLVKVGATGPEDGLAARLGEKLRHELGVELVTVEVSRDTP